MIFEPVPSSRISGCAADAVLMQIDSSSLSSEVFSPQMPGEWTLCHDMHYQATAMHCHTVDTVDFLEKAMEWKRYNRFPCSTCMWCFICSSHSRLTSMPKQCLVPNTWDSIAGWLLGLVTTFSETMCSTSKFMCGTSEPLKTNIINNYNSWLNATKV